MKRVVWNVLLGAVLAAGPAFAQFEGQIDMKITAQNGVVGTGKVFVSKTGTRTEMDMQTTRVPLHMTTLVKFSAPDVMYLINEGAKTWSAVDTKKLREQAAKASAGKPNEPYTVKLLGSPKLLGYDTKHVLLSRPSDKSETEAWTTQSLSGLSYESMRGLVRRGTQEDESMQRALKEAGAEGFFVKMVTREKGKTEFLTTMELTKVEKKPLPAALFELPAGYTKQEGARQEGM